MTENYENSDLALEQLERDALFWENTEKSEQTVGSIRVCRFSVSEESASRFGASCGNYVTFFCNGFNALAQGDREILVRLLCGELRGMSKKATGKRVDRNFSVLIAGLGNQDLTADAVGPDTVRRLVTTRQLFLYEKQLFDDLNCASVAAIAPGVLGQTGMESSEIVKGIIDCQKPDLLLVIDALAARSCQRLATTIQLTDAGIRPGSGIGNHRLPFTKETLGIPVLSIGVPTVVNSSTLVFDALKKGGVTDISEKLAGVLESGRSFFVCPKDADTVTKQVCGILAKAIGLAFAAELSEE